jgi:hypothetical protein
MNHLGWTICTTKSAFLFYLRIPLFQAFGIDGKDITWDTWVDTIELTASRPILFLLFS